MTNNKKDIINANMDDVIKTSQEMRNYLLNEEIELDLRVGKLKIFKTALEANKNIVSASVVQVNIENFKL